MRDAITKAAEFYGGQSALERVCGVSQKNITRYISGKGYRMGVENWQNLYSYCRRFLPEDKAEDYAPENITGFPRTVRTPIWLDKNIKEAIRQAVEEHGGQSALSRATGVPQTSISHYISGKIYKIGEDIWAKLYPACKRYLPPDKVRKYDPENIADFPQVPPMEQDLQSPGSELALPKMERFKPVPVISIAQAAEYEPIQPLVDYLKEVSDKTKLFLEVNDCHFAVEIVGDSMSPAYPDGSVALVDSGDFPENGDIVVAKFSTGQVVIKEYYKNDGMIKLLSRNPHGQNFEWKLKDKPGFIQWIYPVVEITLHPRKQRRRQG
jgi:phage repressor protein C with HTH and peptisase S24 domain